MVKLSWGPGRLWVRYNTQPTNWSYFSAISVLIVDVCLESIYGSLFPLHGCWENTTHLDNIQYSLSSAFEYVFQHISLCWLAHLFSHEKEVSGQQQPQLKSSWHLSGSPWHKKQKLFWWWNAQSYFSHENLDSFIVFILSRWNVVIPTVSRKLDIIHLADRIFIQSLG